MNVFARAIYIQKLIIILFFPVYVYAMELVSFERLHYKVSFLSEYQKEELASKSLIGGIALLPKEVRYTLFKKMCDDEELGIRFDTTPIFDNFALYHQLQAASPLVVGGELLLVSQIMKLPTQKRDQLLAIANPSIFAQVMGETSFSVSEENYKKLMDGMPHEIQSLLKNKLIIVRRDEQLSRLISFGLTMVGFSCYFLCMYKQYHLPYRIRKSRFMRLWYVTFFKIFNELILA